MTGGRRTGAGTPGELRSWGLPPRRRSSLEASRALQARRAMGSPDLPDDIPGVGFERLVLGGVPCVLCEPEPVDATCLWFHGGGFRLGSAAACARFAAALAAMTGCRVVLPDYALAPEEPFPAALHDAATVYDETSARWPSPLLLGGDSAGGGIATSLTVAALRAGRTPPVGIVLLSPWCDLTLSAPTFRTNADTDQLFSAAAAAEAVELYLQGWDALDPLASPALANLAAFPPAALFASTDEVLLGDSERLAAALAGARREVQLHLVPGVAHVWPVLDPEASASLEALERVAHFVRGVIGRGAGPDGEE